LLPDDLFPPVKERTELSEVWLAGVAGVVVELDVNQPAIAAAGRAGGSISQITGSAKGDRNRGVQATGEAEPPGLLQETNEILVVLPGVAAELAEVERRAGEPDVGAAAPDFDEAERIAAEEAARLAADAAAAIPSPDEVPEPGPPLI